MPNVPNHPHAWKAPEQIRAIQRQEVAQVAGEAEAELAAIENRLAKLMGQCDDASKSVLYDACLDVLNARVGLQGLFVKLG